MFENFHRYKYNLFVFDNIALDFVLYSIYHGLYLVAYQIYFNFLSKLYGIYCQRVKKFIKKYMKLK